jgi:hypothetical protein
LNCVENHLAPPRPGPQSSTLPLLPMLVRHTTPTRLRRACVDRRPGPLPPSLSPLLLEASTHTRRSILYWMKSTASDPPSICRTSPCPIHQRGPAAPPPRPAGCPPSLSSLGGRPKLRDPSGFTAQHRRPGLAPHHHDLTSPQRRLAQPSWLGLTKAGHAAGCQ